MPTTNSSLRALPRPSNLVRGVYVLLAAAVLLETQFSLTLYPDDVGRFLPFFQDLATWTHISALKFSVAEACMLILLLITLLRTNARRGPRFDKGSLMRPLSLYIILVVIAEVNGLASGGDFRLSLWEVRGQFYMFVTYILICNLITTRTQLNTLLWILLVGTGLKAIQGIYRYQVSLHGNIHSVESLFPHEQSFFFNAFLLLTAILFLYGGSRRMKRVALVLLPFVAVAALANQRRAAVLALGITLLSLLVITFVVYPARRRVVAAIILLLVVAWIPYYSAFKNSSGLLGEVAHAVASSTTPDPRDASSNLYRINEDKDILATMRTSPIIGYGFGKTMQTPYPLANISNFYIFWNLLPHNSILWVWMRLGTIGYLLLWLMIGTAIVQAARLAREIDDPYLKGLAVFVILLVMQQIIFGYLDLQWTNYRNLIIMGLALALPSRLAAFASASKRVHKHDDKIAGVRARTTRLAYIPPTLAVVNGRLTTKPPARRAG